MKTIYIITQCEKSLSGWYECHFKGYYHGHRIDLIRLRKDKGLELEVGREYVFKTQVLEVTNKKLFATVLNFKDLEDIRVT